MEEHDGIVCGPGPRTGSLVDIAATNAAWEEFERVSVRWPEEERALFKHLFQLVCLHPRLSLDFHSLLYLSKEEREKLVEEIHEELGICPLNIKMGEQK